MKRNILLRRPWLTAGLVAASVVLVSILTLAALNLRHVHASGGGGGGGYNACLYTGGDPACHFSGAGAQGAFSYADASNCVFTSVNVFVAESVLHSQPGAPTPASQVFVSLYRYDSCNGAGLNDAFGSATNVNFRHDVGLQSASLDATVPMTDYYTGTSYPVTISLTWKGFGDTSTYMDNAQYRTEHVVFRSRFSGDSRQAVASGTISDGTTNYAAGPGIGYTYSFQAGTLDIFH